MTNQELASQLVNTPHAPANYITFAGAAREARAYFRLNPYPFYYFSDWRTETRGPLPRCLPTVRNAICKGARWLFGKSPGILVSENEKAEAILIDLWKKNRMPTQMVAAARMGGTEGGFFIKYAYDPDQAVPVTFQILNLVDDVQVYCHPHNRDLMLMVRIQYPFYRAEEGKWYWYREEWTDEEFISYRWIEDSKLTRSDAKNPYSGLRGPAPDQWQIEDRSENPFGIIPGIAIRNRDGGGLFGEGDFADCFRIFDRINLTVHQADRSNQLDSESNVVIVDGQVAEDELDTPLAPGEPLAITSTSDTHQAQVELLERGGKLREPMRAYAEDLKMELLEAGGSVQIRPDLITNKGNMTSAVMAMLYEPLVEATEDKRKTYGDDGLCQFFDRMAIGLGNVEAFGGIFKTPIQTSLKWAPFFDMTPDEKQAITETTEKQVRLRFLPHERAVERIAAVEGINDVKELKDEIGTVNPPADPYNHIQPISEKEPSVNI